MRKVQPQRDIDTTKYENNLNYIFILTLMTDFHNHTNAKWNDKGTFLMIKVKMQVFWNCH